MEVKIRMYAECKATQPATTLLEVCITKIQRVMKTMKYDLSVLPRDLLDLVKQSKEWTTPLITPEAVYSEVGEELPGLWDGSLWEMLSGIRSDWCLPTAPFTNGLPHNVSIEVKRQRFWVPSDRPPRWILASDLLNWRFWKYSFQLPEKGTRRVVLGNKYGYFLNLVKKLVKEHASGNAANLRLIYWLDHPASDDSFYILGADVQTEL